MPPEAVKRTRNRRVDPKRLGQVADLMASNTDSREIVRKLAEKHGVSERTIYKDIERVNIEAVKFDVQDRPYRKSKMRRTLNQFYTRAMARRAFGPALQALDRLCKLDGLYEPEKVELEGKIAVHVSVAKMTTAQRRARIHELLKLRREQVDGRRAPAFIEAESREATKTNGANGGNGTNGA